MNEKFVKCAIHWSKSSKCVGKEKNLENLLKWYHFTTKKDKQYNGFNSWQSRRKKDAIKAMKINEIGKILPPLNINEMQNYVNKFLFEIITKNPQTDFYIIIPTLSRFFWKMPNQPSYHRNRTAKQFFAELK